jgi:S1-C subfamily serine protease
MGLHRRLFRALGPLPFLLLCATAAAANEPAERMALNFSEARRQDLALTRTGARRTQVVGAIERVKAAVVNIHSERTLPGNDVYALNASQNRVNGMGTGIIIDPRGYIVTNQHVVDDVNLLRIRLADGTAMNAVVVARHPEMDLALLKIDAAQPLPTMPIGTATDLMVGETVIAIGNAYGYEHTASVGIVSALKRDVTLNKDMAYKSLIQTDASINPGNSGGPLINVAGELVGVNVAIRAGAQGIGFAIPADHMIRSVAEMLKGRRRGQTFDGLSCRDRLDQGADGFTRSVIIERSEGPASQAGLRPGDVLLQIGDVKVSCTYDVERGMLDHKNGDSIPVLVRRKDQEQKRPGAGGRRRPSVASGGRRRAGLVAAGRSPRPRSRRAGDARQSPAPRRPGNHQRPVRQRRRPLRPQERRHPRRPAPVGDSVPGQRHLRPQPSRSDELQSPLVLHPPRRPGSPRQFEPHPMMIEYAWFVQELAHGLQVSGRR